MIPAMLTMPSNVVRTWRAFKGRSGEPTADGTWSDSGQQQVDKQFAQPGRSSVNDDVPMERPLAAE